MPTALTVVVPNTVMFPPPAMYCAVPDPGIAIPILAWVRERHNLRPLECSARRCDNRRYGSRRSGHGIRERVAVAGWREGWAVLGMKISAAPVVSATGIVTIVDYLEGVVVE